MCYYCKHGFPPKVQAIIDEVEEVAPLYVAHVVMEDCNLDDASIDYELDQLTNPSHRDWMTRNNGVTMEQVDAAVAGLRKLRALSPEDRHLAQAAAYA